MSQSITITNEEILAQIKLSFKIPEITEQIITNKIIKTTAEEAGIKVETHELQKAADNIRLINQLNSADDTWAWLEKHSLSIDEFKEIVYSNIIFGKLAVHLFANQVESYFFEHLLDYTGVVMYEIIFDDEDLAIEAFYAIKEEEMSFYDAARKYITDKELRRKGGYRGIVHRQDLEPEISAIVFAVKTPQILKPIVTSKGVHLILVEEVIQPELSNKLRSKIMSDLFSAWLKEKSSLLEFNTKNQ